MPLAKAYYLKEDLRQFLWEQSDRRAAERFLTHWIRKADASGIRMLKDFARTLAIHRRGLLAWYRYPISTGPLEGTNNKIRALTRQAYGFRGHRVLHPAALRPSRNPIPTRWIAFNTNGARTSRMNRNSARKI